MNNNAPEISQILRSVSEEIASESSAVVHFSICECLNYASWQNDVPFIRSIKIENTTKDVLENLTLEFSSSPAFARPKQWSIDSIGPNQTVTLADCDVEFDADYLAGLNEAERGRITLRLSGKTSQISASSHDLRVLAHNQWGGVHAMGELLAAFVMPNDPAIARILKSAGEILETAGHSSALDGYQSKDPRRAYLLAAAIWSAIAAEKLTYANPPASFERVGQKVRCPSQTINEGLGTCLDTTLLFASALEATGLHPLIVLQDGHCFVGCWLIESSLGTLVESDCTEVRKAIDVNELITFETTLVAGGKPAPFGEAIRAARHATSESEEHQFVAAIDIERARMAQIRPLASHDAPSSETSDDQPSGPLPLPEAPEFTQLPTDEVEAKPTTPDGRIDRWQRKLLDLSLRNRLLNFRATKQAVQFLCPNVPLLEDKLADGKKLRVVSIVDENPIGERNPETYRQKTNKDLDGEFALSALERDEITSTLDGRSLNASLTALYRRVRNDLSEGGSNTLFLAIGFLKWKKSPEDTKSYRAPLLLVPVKLTRRSAISPFYLAQHEDEARFNATLIQFLKKDFARDLSRFESDLPMDDSGVDVPRVLDEMRREVRGIPGFEVIDETALSTFSFAKYLMWKDLVDRIDQLEQNRVVRHLVRDPDKPFESDALSTIPEPEEIDIRYGTSELVHPLPADSSQLSAVMAAAEGQDFVLVGPPGTGKSQTIANMIAQCLARKKTVLFVAEKTAALDVVHRRLKENGLGDFCIELHSNKAERRKFLDQLQSAWESGRKNENDDWMVISHRLQIRRDELNQYVEALHEKDTNGFSIFEGMGISVRAKNRPITSLSWKSTIRHDLAQYQKMVDSIADLSRTYQAISPGVALDWVQRTEWSAAWESSLLEQARKAAKAASRMQVALQKLSNALQAGAQVHSSTSTLALFARMAKCLKSASTGDYRVVFHKKFSKLPEQLDAFQKSVSRFQQARESVAAVYDQSLTEIPVDEIQQQWRTAESKFWPLSYFAKRKAIKFLQTFAEMGKADPLTDLKAIREMQQATQQIDENLWAKQTTDWAGLDTDMGRLRRHFASASEIRDAAIALGKATGKLPEVSKAIAPVLTTNADSHPILDGCDSYLAAWEEFNAEYSGLRDLCGSQEDNEKADHLLQRTIDACEQIQSNHRELRLWTAWCEVRKRARALGLTEFVHELESSESTPDELPGKFELSYVRWWLPHAIDRSDVLRQFQRYQHEDAIQEFRALDDTARQASSEKVRQSIAHRLPTPQMVPRKSELGLLRHQMGLRRPSKSIRQVISDMPEYFGTLAPCLLMSPLSIAQYLPTEQKLFDVVIFDEASQITTWDAIGAIARGRQTIIVGDPKQLPPTNFFGRSQSDEDDDELDDYEKDLESILDESKASGLPTLQLNWHYRSQHESLISFSNWHYYANKLITFPSAVTDDRSVSLKVVPDAVYDGGKGASRTNESEAKTIVADAVARMKQWLELPEDDRPTLGVVTFNSSQQSLILDLLDKARSDDPTLEWFFDDERIEPTIVKNLENVQGDERDVMFFSITYGKQVSGRLSRNFGPMSQEGGDRRLNVAVTRARQEMVAYSSFKAEELSIEGLKHRGVRDLKSFLEYAEKGPIALAAEIQGSEGSFESPLEEAIAEALESKGWQLRPQIGVSGFRVDLGVVHPDKPGVYLAGVECDGATYHRSASARDRDKTREQILRNLGWNILRVWSPEWWYDGERALESLHEALKELLDNSRATENEQPEPQDTENVDDGLEQSTVEQDLVPKPPGQFEFEQNHHTIDSPQYSQTELGDNSPHAHRFHDDDYAETLKEMAMKVLEQEAPIREDLLAQRVARSHGFARTGAKIKDRVLSLIEDIESTNEPVGRFLWNGEPTATVSFREQASEEDRRSVDEISLPELCGLISSTSDILSVDDPVVPIARKIGLGRVAKSARVRIEEAIDKAKELRQTNKSCD